MNKEYKDIVYVTPFLDGQSVKDHYSHEIVVANYGNGTSYSLECLDCCEVICDSENPRSRLYKTLKRLYELQTTKTNFMLSFDRYGGLYGKLCYWYEELETPDSIAVMQSKYLI